MRILQVISAFYPALALGGPSKVAYDISKELARRGHEVEVFTTNAYDQNHNFRPKLKVQTMIGFKVTYFSNLLRFDNVFLSYEMVVALRKRLGEFDIVHMHHGRQAHDIAVSHYARKHDVPYVVQAHGDLPRIMSKRRLKWLYDIFFGYEILSNASKAIALSINEAEDYRRMGVPSDKITVIPNGIDLTEYADLPPRGSLRKKLGIGEDDKIVLYLGRLHEIKGIDVLVKAFASIAGRLENVMLLIVGPDDGYLGRTKALVKALKMEDHVLLLGSLYGEDKIGAYADADLYVLPSRYETFPMSVLEAYACGKPVIATRVCGLGNLVIDGKTGLLVEPGDTKQLAKSMLSLLEDENRALEIGQKGKRFVRENFVLGKVVDSLEQAYEAIVD